MKLTYQSEIHNRPIQLNNFFRTSRGKSSTLFLVLIFFLSLPFAGIGILFIFMIITPPLDGRLDVGLGVALPSFIFGLAGIGGLNHTSQKLFIIYKNKVIKLADSCVAKIDYPWDTSGYTPDRALVSKGLIWTIFTTFLVIFIYVAFAMPEKILLALPVAFISIFCSYTTGITFGRAIRFGKSRIIFDNFPYYINKPFVIKWLSPRGLSEVNEGAFILRCVKESYNKGRLEYHELWSGTWLLDQNQKFLFYAGETYSFYYTTPKHLPPTHLNSDTPIYWEFEIKLKTSGFDFVETYLVPIY